MEENKATEKTHAENEESKTEADSRIIRALSPRPVVRSLGPNLYPSEGAPYVLLRQTYTRHSTPSLPLPNPAISAHEPTKRPRDSSLGDLPDHLLVDLDAQSRSLQRVYEPVAHGEHFGVVHVAVDVVLAG